MPAAIGEILLNDITAESYEQEGATLVLYFASVLAVLWVVLRWATTLKDESVCLYQQLLWRQLNCLPTLLRFVAKLSAILPVRIGAVFIAALVPAIRSLTQASGDSHMLRILFQDCEEAEAFDGPSLVSAPIVLMPRLAWSCLVLSGLFLSCLSGRV